MGLVSARVVTSVAALTIVLAMACRDVDSFTGGGGTTEDGGALPSSDASPACSADTQVSIDNCGTCENRCPVRANGVPECAAGVCRTKCNPGFGDCDGNPENGCETSVRDEAAHCGACGRSCGGSACTDGKCAPTKLVTGQNGLYSVASDGEHVYYSSSQDGSAYRCPVTSCPAPLKIGSGNERSYFLAIDATHVFWNNNSTSGQTAPGKVFRALKVGQQLGDEIATAPHASAANPTQVAVDAKNVYWSSNEGTIWRAPKDKSAGPTAITKVTNSAYLVVVDGTLYIGSSDGNAVFTCPIGGCASPPPKLVAAPQTSVGGIASDGTTLFWTTNDSVVSFAIGGATGTVKLTSVVGSGAVAVAGNDVYFTERAAGRVLTVPKTGGTATPLAQNQVGLNNIAVDDKFLYWVSTGEGAIYKLAR